MADSATTTSRSKPGPLCHLCPLKDAPGPIWGEGRPDAKLVFVGMAPASDEVEAGRPFVGGAGRILSRACYASGIDRGREAFTTNMVKCFVAPKSHLPADAVRCCKPILDQELQCLRDLKVTVTLGQEPFDYLTGKKLALKHNIKAARKNLSYWLRGNPYRQSTESPTCILPTFHPAGIAYSGFLASPYFESDLRKAKRYSEGGLRCWKETFNYNPTNQEVQDYVSECIRRGSFGLDIETQETKVDEDEEEFQAQEDASITVVGISHTVGDCIGVSPSQMPLLQPLLQAGCTCYAFNWGFDGYYLSREIALHLKPFDVMLALHELYSDISPKDLATALSMFTDMPYHKNLMASQPDIYNARDTYGALYAGQECERLLDTYNLRRLFEHQDMPTIPVLSDMQHIGVKCDVPAAERMELSCYLQLESYETFWKQALPLVDWQSPTQLVELFRQQGLPIKMMTRTRKDKTKYKSPSVDEDVLENYRDKHKSQLAGLVLLMRKLKRASDFCHLHSSDGRMHSRYKPHGTGTGRLSCREPNIQNVPEIIAEVFPRRIIIPDNEDSLLIVSDFSQIELWIYAYVSDDKPFLAAKERGDYVHGQAYEDLFGKPFFQPGQPRQKAYKRKEVEPWELLAAKTIPLGMLYGREVDSLMESGLSRAKAEEVYGTFHSRHPAIKAFHRRLDHEVQQKGYLRNCFGRIRRFPNSAMQRNEYLAFPGQSNASDILRRNALIPLHRGLPRYGARILLTVHDSVAISCPKAAVSACVEYVRDTLEQPIAEMSNFWIPCEIAVGPNWQDTTLWEDYNHK